MDLQLALDFIGQFSPLVNGLTPALVEESQLAGQFIIGFPSLEPIAMIIEQFTNELCIGAIIFGAPWTKGLAKAGHLTGIDWIEFQVRVPIKDIYVRALCVDFRQRLTQSHTPELTPEACGPCHRLVA